MPKESIQDLKSNLHAAIEDALEAMFALGEQAGYRACQIDNQKVLGHPGYEEDEDSATDVEQAAAQTATAAEPEKPAQPAFNPTDYRHLNGPGETALCGEVSTGLEVLDEALPLQNSSRVTCPKCKAIANVN